MDKPDIALLSPSQAYFLRENLKLRLLSARQALLARDGTSFKADIDASMDWIGRYYDNNSKSVVNMIETLHQLRESEVGIELPRISAVSMRCATIVLPVIGEIDEGALWLLALFFFAVAVTLAAQIQQRLCAGGGSPLSYRAIAQFAGGVAAGNVFYRLFCSAAGCHYFPVANGSERFRSRRRREKARMVMLDGLRAFFEGRYAKAERASAAALELGESPIR